MLLVDDEPQVLVALEDLLAEKFDIFKADNGDTALNVIEREPGIAVVVTDQRMPQMNGDELLSKLGVTSDAMRILVTGFADLKAVIRAVNEGKIFAYVTKPWDQQDLLLKVEKAAEQFHLGRELAYERQLLRDLMNSTPDGIYFKDRHRRFLRANRAFAECVADVVPDALVGKRLEDLGVAPQAFTGAEASDDERVLQQGVPAADIVRELPRDGGSSWYSETKAPIKDAHGAVIGLVGILRDITRQRSLEQQLAQSQKMEAIGQLAGGVSHDLNNLLAVIGGYGQLVFQALPPADPKREDMAEILGATRRAENLIRQLLTFSRRQVVQPKILNLNDAVASLEKILARVISENIEITTILHPELGLVRADENQIDQVILNLAVNARDAMPTGGRLVLETANVVLDRAPSDANVDTGVDGAGSVEGAGGKFVMLSVSDTGVGMDANTKRHIFEPFFTTKEVGKGTGLGLSTVYGITQQSGGHIEVDSVVGRGTTFRIYFPRVEGAVGTSERRSDRPTGHYGSGTILLVEDNSAVRQMVARILRERGFTVREAAHPEEALVEGARQDTQFDLILTDVVMPKMSGPELVERLRERFSQLRVLYMSGYAGAPLAKDGGMQGEAYIEKPFTPDSLVETVHALLNTTG